MDGLNIISTAAELTDAGANLSRRRYQKGTVEIHNNQWTLRYLEDVLQADGFVKRCNRRVYLGGSPPKMTEKMARRLAEPIMAEANGVTKPKQLSTLSEFVARWQPLCMPKTETARNFRTALHKHLIPVFGKRQLAEIQTEDLQRFISQVQTGPANLHNIIKCFRAIWKSAKAWGYVKHNPFADVIMPALKRPEPRFFTEEEMCRILNSAPEPHKSMYWLLAQTGLRIGEILALTWETVDLELGIVQVRSSVSRGRLRESETKTQASKRILPLSPRLQEHLFTYRTKIWTANEGNLLFANPKGKPWNADKLLERVFQPYLETLGIEHAGFHAFRHASNTALSRRNVPIEIRRARLGHTDDEMTLRYSHVMDDDARSVAAMYDQFLLPEMTMEVGA